MNYVVIWNEILLILIINKDAKMIFIIRVSVKEFAKPYVIKNKTNKKLFDSLFIVSVYTRKSRSNWIYAGKIHNKLVTHELNTYTPNC